LTDLARGNLTKAAVQLREAAAMKLDGEWTWDVPLQLGGVEEKLGNAGAAEAAYRDAIKAVGVLRTSSGEYEPTVIATHRQPHEALMGLLASQRQWGAVLEVLLELDARHMIAAVASPARLSSDGTLLAAKPSQPVLPLDHSAASAPSIQDVVKAWS